MAYSGPAYSMGKISNEKALQKLKHYCGYQERSHKEVKQKLYALGLFKKDVEELITRLIEEGYLNEERFSIQFASGKLKIKGWGRQKIKYALQQKGISAFCIIKALNALDHSEYQKIFETLALKKWKALSAEKNNFVKKSKWQQYLLQRGFEYALFKSFFLDINENHTPED